VKRLVLWAASAVVSCSSLVVVVGGTSFAGTPGGATVVNAHLIRAGRAPSSSGQPCQNPCESVNWSGYAQAAARHTFTEVTDTFVVPTVTASTAGREFAADWVGIGGFFPSDPTLVQAGFQTVVKKTGKKTTVHYGAWTEILPQAEDPLGLVISAGNVVTVTVQETAVNVWTMTVDDVTSGQSGVRTVSYQSKGMSAEAIHERPCIKGSCDAFTDLATLARTSAVTFDPGSFSETPPGTTPVTLPLLTSALPDPGQPKTTLWDIAMTADNETTVIATPSDPNIDSDGFTVADGAVAPPAPTV
jgi:hypothetical protein